MLPPSMLPMPATWGDLLGELGPVFRRRSTYQLFVLLACGMILAGRRTVVAMAAAAGIADQFRRACWFFSGAVRDIDDLGLAVAGLIVKYLVPAGAPVTVAVGGTFFRRWGARSSRPAGPMTGPRRAGRRSHPGTPGRSPRSS